VKSTKFNSRVTTGATGNSNFFKFFVKVLRMQEFKNIQLGYALENKFEKTGLSKYVCMPV
jgi:hypothetical protein